MRVDLLLHVCPNESRLYTAFTQLSGDTLVITSLISGSSDIRSISASVHIAIDFRLSILQLFNQFAKYEPEINEFRH